MPQLEKYSLIPAFFATLVLFISLSVLIAGAGNIFMSAIVSALSFPVIYIFCLIGCALIQKISFQNNNINYLFAGISGVFLGLVGFFIANKIAYFNGTLLAFILSGLVAGLVMHYQITVNKSHQRTP
jgi:hypothetical protein